jgi:hypothetical protein
MRGQNAKPTQRIICETTKELAHLQRCALLKKLLFSSQLWVSSGVVMSRYLLLLLLLLA